MYYHINSVTDAIKYYIKTVNIQKDHIWCNKVQINEAMVYWHFDMAFDIGHVQDLNMSEQDKFFFPS